MNKATLKRVIIVILGICAIMLLFSFVSLIIDAVGFSDMKDNQNAVTLSVMSFTKWTSIATVCILVPLFASYVFSCISKHVAFCITSSVLSLITTACAISFICVLRQHILDTKWNSNDYASLVAYMQEMITVIVPCIVGFIYYTLRSVQMLMTKQIKPDKTEVNEL